MQGNEAELLERLRDGNAAAAVQLYDRFAKDVNRLVWRFLGADQEHDDVVQQVFINAIANVHKVREAQALRGWMVSLTVNTVRGEIRKRRVRRAFFADREEGVPELTHVDDHEGRKLLRRTYAVLDKIPGDDRIAFMLRYLERQTQEEIAQACGCSVPTVKRRLKRATDRFNKLAARDPLLAARLQRDREEDA